MERRSCPVVQVHRMVQDWSLVVNQQVAKEEGPAPLLSPMEGEKVVYMQFVSPYVYVRYVLYFT